MHTKSRDHHLAQTSQRHCSQSDHWYANGGVNVFDHIKVHPYDIEIKYRKPPLASNSRFGGERNSEGGKEQKWFSFLHFISCSFLMFRFRTKKNIWPCHKYKSLRASSSFSVTCSVCGLHSSPKGLGATAQSCTMCTLKKMKANGLHSWLGVGLVGMASVPPNNTTHGELRMDRALVAPPSGHCATAGCRGLAREVRL